MTGPADAASSPIAACGGGSYHVIGHHDLGKIATVYLLYNGRTDCVVTWKKRAYVGKRTKMLASIAKNTGTKTHYNFKYINNYGTYGTYAGPVKVTAPHTCIDWGGGTGPGWKVWYSGRPSHCG
ncbi:hypothetical protein AB0L00_32640 [Actinoallomurus sp. NPDC052308]|uniref:hypothetical protein n=1 Tax=Actinoallomurus sp. NPDC052308 TaxID=3155530 RepID=UPI0034311BAC